MKKSPYYPHIKVGDKVGRLTVLSRQDTSRSVWTFRCVCGTEFSVQPRFILRGESRSCGCYRRELAAANSALEWQNKLAMFVDGLVAEFSNPAMARHGVTTNNIWIKHTPCFSSNTMRHMMGMAENAGYVRCLVHGKGGKFYVPAMPLDEMRQQQAIAVKQAEMRLAEVSMEYAHEVKPIKENPPVDTTAPSIFDILGGKMTDAVRQAKDRLDSSLQGRVIVVQ